GLPRVEVGEPFDHEPGGPLEPAEGVVSVPVAGELLLHEQRTGGLHHLNPAAALLWACLLDGLDAEASAAELAAASGAADPAAVAGEVAAFHAWVREAGLAVEPART
ncbi:MAG: PqqD family peptide modification chaperone, partial [Actinomycetota bacterium]